MAIELLNARRVRGSSTNGQRPASGFEGARVNRPISLDEETGSRPIGTTGSCPLPVVLPECMSVERQLQPRV